MQPIKIAIVDDQYLFCKAMESLIHSFSNTQVIFTALNGKQFIDSLKASTEIPEIVMLDINMPIMDGLETLTWIKQEYPEIHVIMLSFHNEPHYIRLLVENGASGYLTKDALVEEVEQTIRKVNENGWFFNDTILEIANQQFNNDENNFIEQEKEKLTNRELEVLSLICQQKSTKQIADKLFVSKKTIDKNRASLMKKAKVNNSIGLVVYAFSNNIFKA